MIQEVCKHLHKWKQKGYPLYPISINVSPKRFLRQELVSTITNCLEKYQLPPEYIELEITESSLLKNDQSVAKTLTRLQNIGVNIAIDDFGTGYSSFHYLQTYHFDTLKIDQTFIQFLIKEQKAETREASIISAFLHLAHNLNIEAVAEGVEEYEQLEFLKQKQCDLVQGFLFSKPVPVSEFEQMMQTRYLKPKKQKQSIKPDRERRKYFRLQFSNHVQTKMSIIEIGSKQVNMGYAYVLVENISLEGIRFLSTLHLPVNKDIKLSFTIKLIDEIFHLQGTLVYRNEDKPNIFSYGIKFDISKGQQDQLAEVINKLTVATRFNREISGTNFIDEDAYIYLRKTLE